MLWSKKKILLVAVAYKSVPLVLIGAWMMPAVFDLFHVSWSDTTWRMYAATTGAWVTLESPLLIFLGIRAFSKKGTKVEAESPS